MLEIVQSIHDQYLSLVRENVHAKTNKLVNPYFSFLDKDGNLLLRAETKKASSSDAIVLICGEMAILASIIGACHITFSAEVSITVMKQETAQKIFNKDSTSPDMEFVSEENPLSSFNDEDGITKGCGAVTAHVSAFSDQSFTVITSTFTSEFDSQVKTDINETPYDLPPDLALTVDSNFNAKILRSGFIVAPSQKVKPHQAISVMSNHGYVFIDIAPHLLLEDLSETDFRQNENIII